MCSGPGPGCGFVKEAVPPVTQLKAGVGTRMLSYAISGFVRVQPVDQAGNATDASISFDTGTFS